MIRTQEHPARIQVRLETEVGKSTKVTERLLWVEIRRLELPLTQQEFYPHIWGFFWCRTSQEVLRRKSEWKCLKEGVYWQDFICCLFNFPISNPEFHKFVFSGHYVIYRLSGTWKKVVSCHLPGRSEEIIMLRVTGLMADIRSMGLENRKNPL